MSPDDAIVRVLHFPTNIYLPFAQTRNQVNRDVPPKDLLTFETKS